MRAGVRQADFQPIVVFAIAAGAAIGFTALRLPFVPRLRPAPLAGAGGQRQLARLIEEIQAAGVPAIFTENIGNSAVIQQVADEAGVTVAPPLYTGALGVPATAGDSYLKLMRYNAEMIVGALKSAGFTD